MIGVNKIYLFLKKIEISMKFQPAGELLFMQGGNKVDLDSQGGRILVLALRTHYLLITLVFAF